MKRWILILIAATMLLSGCSRWLDGSYISVTPHQEQADTSGSGIVSVSSYNTLRRALENLIQRGKETGVISVAHYDQLSIARDTRIAIFQILANNPFANYAVENIDYELGTNAGEPALAVNIQYIHGKTEPSKIQSVDTVEDMQTVIGSALDSCYSGLVLHIEQYVDTDIDQWIADYSQQNPHKVIELPQTAVTLYPQEGGVERILEIKFSYQHSRDTLRQMQEQVNPVFSQLQLSATPGNTQIEKYQQIFQSMAQQMENFHMETSITPAYSLLMHGVGDSRAAATVYAALCQKNELDCQYVTGTHNAEPWNWNILRVDDQYYHFDFLRCLEEGSFHLMSETDMAGYVWNYTEYPATGENPEIPPTNPAPTTSNG